MTSPQILFQLGTETDAHPLAVEAVTSPSGSQDRRGWRALERFSMNYINTADTDLSSQ